jgi:hypothetical protein
MSIKLTSPRSCALHDREDNELTFPHYLSLLSKAEEALALAGKTGEPLMICAQCEERIGNVIKMKKASGADSISPRTAAIDVALSVILSESPSKFCQL